MMTTILIWQCQIISRKRYERSGAEKRSEYGISSKKAAPQKENIIYPRAKRESNGVPRNIHALDKDIIKRRGRRIRNKQARFDTRGPKS